MLLDEFDQGFDVETGGGRLGFLALPGFLETLAGAFDGLEDAVAIEGLQKVVDGVDVERADRVLVEGGGKDDLRELFAFAQLNQFFEHREAIEARHLDVEKNHVGMMGADEVDGFDAVLALAEHVDAAGGIEEVFKLLAGQLFIVDDEGGDGHGLDLRHSRV